MKTHNFYTKIALTALAAFSIVAGATPTIDSITVQGYMRNATNTAVTDGTYNIAYMVLQGGAVVWGKEYSTVVTNGLFSKTLSGLGQDLTAGGAWANCTGEANFSAATLNPALLIGAGAGATVVRVCSRSTIDSVQPEFDITVAAAPTALIADTAYGVVAGSLSVAAFAATAYTNTSAGAGDANKLVQLDAGGLLDTTLLPVVPVANGGTGGATAAAARTGIGAAESGANSTITSLTGLTTPLSGDQGGVGMDLTTAAAGGIPYADGTALQVTAAGTAGDIFVSGGAGAPSWTTSLNPTGAFALGGAATTSVTVGGAGTTTVTVGNNATTTATVGGTGLTTLGLGNAATGALTTTAGGSAGASATTVQSGTGGTTITSTGTAATAVNITATGVDGGITLAPNGAGRTTAGNLTANGLSFGTPTNSNIGGATTYNDATPFTYTTSFHTITMTANVAVSLRCIDSSAAEAGSVLLIVFNPTAAAHTANTWTVLHNQACTGNNKAIYTNTVGTLTGATNNSPSSIYLIYDGTRWQVISWNT